MRRLTVKVACVFLFFFGSSCVPFYEVRINDLKEQFSAIDSSKFINTEIKGFYGDVYTYLANPVDYIRCFDKHNKPINIENSSSVELKVLEKDNKKTIFYLDRVFVNDSLLYGFESRMQPKRKVVNLNNVKKIQCSGGRGYFEKQN